MSDCSSEVSVTSQHSCECYKRLQTFGIPLYIRDENDFYSENQKIITYENAFKLPGFLVVDETITEYPVVEDNEMPHIFELLLDFENFNGYKRSKQKLDIHVQCFKLTHSLPRTSILVCSRLLGVAKRSILVFDFIQMAQVIPNLSDYELNVLSFWILDIIIEGLWTVQSAKMDFEHQKVTLLWIAYLFNYIQKHNPTRRELFNHIKIILFEQDDKNLNDDLDERIGEFVRKSSKGEESESSYVKSKIWEVPLPPDLDDVKKFQDSKINLSSMGENEWTGTDSGDVKSSLSSIDSLKNKETVTETNICHMKIILDVLYRIFARLWVYLEIQTVFHAMPPAEQVDLPFKLKIPKPILKVEPPTPARADRNGKKHSFSEKSVEEFQTEKQLQRNAFILPLQASEEAKLYVKTHFLKPASQRSVLDKNKEEKHKK